MKDNNWECGKHYHMTSGNHLTNCPLNTQSYIEPSKEWVNGLLPVGARFEVQNTASGEWCAGTVSASGEKNFLVFMDIDDAETMLKKERKFRPICTQKQRVIDKAEQVAKACNWTAAEYLSDLYDAGMLSMPNDKEGE